MTGHRRANDDAGATMMELVVAMTLLSIFLGVFSTAVYSMTRTVSKVDAVVASSDQVNQAFLELDKTVRYANAITTAGTSSASGNWYVEYNTVASGPDVCTQLRIDKTARQLQSRTWTVISRTSYTTPTPWRMLANNVTNGTAGAGSTDQPFSVPPAAAGATTSFQRLTITVVAQSGTTTAANTRAAITFTAINSTATEATNKTRCQQVGRP